MEEKTLTLKSLEKEIKSELKAIKNEIKIIKKSLGGK